MVMAVPSHPDDPSAVAVLLKYDIEGTLHVHMLVRRPLLHRDRQIVHGTPEMLGEHGTKRGLVHRASLRDEPTHEVAAVPTDVGQLRGVIVGRSCNTRNRGEGHFGRVEADCRLPPPMLR